MFGGKRKRRLNAGPPRHTHGPVHTRAFAGVRASRLTLIKLEPAVPKGENIIHHVSLTSLPESLLRPGSNASRKEKWYEQEEEKEEVEETSEIDSGAIKSHYEIIHLHICIINNGLYPRSVSRGEEVPGWGLGAGGWDAVPFFMRVLISG